MQQQRGWAHALVFYTVLLFSVVLALPANAVTLEQVARSVERGRRVYDLAGVLSREQQLQVQRSLGDLEERGLAEGAVVLVDRAEGHTVREFATELLNRWGVGDRRKANGFVLVLSIGERRWEVETGRGLEGVLPDQTVARIARRELVPALRDGRYVEGLTATLTAFGEEVQKAGGAEAIPEYDRPTSTAGAWPWLTMLLGLGTLVLAFRSWPRGTRENDPLRLPAILLGFASLGVGLFAAMQVPGQALSMVMLGVPGAAFAGLRLFEASWVPGELEKDLDTRPALLFAGILGIGLVVWMALQPSGWIIAYLALSVPLFFAVRGYFHRVPRRCPECGGNLHWVAERDEPEFLKPAEDAEQRLGSVNYDVWRCDKCRRSAIFNRGGGPTPHEACPQCGRHTLTRHAQMLGGSSWGRREMEVVTECHNPECRHRDVQRRSTDEGGGWGDGGFGGGGIIFIPPIFGGGWGGGGGGQQGDSGGWGGWGGGGDSGWGDFGDFGGGDSGGGGAGGDW